MKLKKYKKTKIGFVTSNKMDKTIIVTEYLKIRHFRYDKLILRKKKYFVHDETNSCNIGFMVKIIETRPVSKNKTWNLLDILKK